MRQDMHVTSFIYYMPWAQGNPAGGCRDHPRGKEKCSIIEQYDIEMSIAS